MKEEDQLLKEAFKIIKDYTDDRVWNEEVQRWLIKYGAFLIKKQERSENDK